MPMNPEVKKLWLEALRSGEYAQAQGKLRAKMSKVNDEDAFCFCCLGVLCDIKAKQSKDPSELVWEEEFSGHLFLPSDVMLWAGITFANPYSSGPNDGLPGSAKSTGEEKGLLSSLNDEGATFAEIADIIEKNF